MLHTSLIRAFCSVSNDILILTADILELDLFEVFDSIVRSFVIVKLLCRAIWSLFRHNIDNLLEEISNSVILWLFLIILQSLYSDLLNLKFIH